MADLDVTFDPEADAAYIHFRKIGSGDAVEQIVVEEAPGMVVLDLDRERRIIGVEVIGARAALPPDLLAKARNL